MAEVARSVKPAEQGVAAGLVSGGVRARVGQRVRVPKTAELVATALRRQIIRGELPAGTHHLDGAQALALARTRKNTCRPGEDDLDRAKR